MKYDFDKLIDRKNTNSIKYDFLEENGFLPDTIPLWVADMDFSAPVEVIEKLKEVAAHGIFGYSETKEQYFRSVHDWFSVKYGFDTMPEWMIKTPGVVFAIAVAIRAFSKEGEGILIQRPVYYPFERLIKKNNRKLINSPLLFKNERYSIDFEDFENKLRTGNVKLFILCSPHNPVGRVWSEEELSRIGELCLKYKVVVVSDEIHCDFTYANHRHTSFAAISPEFAQNSIICTSPTKTFNLAGLKIANIFIPNTKLRQQFKEEISKTGFGGLDTFGLAACEAAYSFGDEWLLQLKEYLQGNLDFVREFIIKYLPDVRLIEPEGTYLLWVDFSGLNLSDSQINNIIKNKARLWLSDGSIFGEEGKGFQRINIACPRKNLSDALLRLQQALDTD